MRGDAIRGEGGSWVSRSVASRGTWARTSRRLTQLSYLRGRFATEKRPQNEGTEGSFLGERFFHASARHWLASAWLASCWLTPSRLTPSRLAPYCLTRCSWRRAGRQERHLLVRATSRGRALFGSLRERATNRRVEARSAAVAFRKKSEPPERAPESTS